MSAITDIDLENANWKRFLNTIASSNIYNRVIATYKLYEERERSRPNVDPVKREELIIKYFDDLHESGLSNGDEEDIPQVNEIGKQKASSLWTILSVIKQFYKLTQNYDIDKNLPIISKMLKGWGKDEKTQKSETFDFDEMTMFLRKPANEKILILQVTAVVSLNGLLRIHECMLLKFTDLKKCSDHYEMKFHRGKQRNANTCEQMCFIKNEDCMRILDLYISLFSEADKSLHEGRLLRKLGTAKNGKVKSTASVIGKNTLAVKFHFVMI